MTKQHLPVHPFTKLTAIGLRRDGRPIWPIMGGSEPADPPTDPPADPPADPPGDPAPKPDDQLGDAGKKALAAERKRATEAEKELARYRKAEQDKADADKSELQKAAEAREAAEKRAVDAESRALRLEVAQEKGLTAAQAKRLQGSTREELETDAEELLAAFPAQPAAPAKPAVPKPDPSQGARGNAPEGRPHSLGEAVRQHLTAQQG